MSDRRETEHDKLVFRLIDELAKQRGLDMPLDTKGLMAIKQILFDLSDDICLAGWSENDYRLAKQLAIKEVESLEKSEAQSKRIAMMAPLLVVPVAFYFWKGNLNTWHLLAMLFAALALVNALFSAGASQSGRKKFILAAAGSLICAVTAVLIPTFVSALPQSIQTSLELAKGVACVGLFLLSLRLLRAT